MQDAWHKYGGIGDMKSNEARGWRVVWVVGELSVGPPSEVDPVDWKQTKNKQINQKMSFEVEPIEIETMVLSKSAQATKLRKTYSWNSGTTGIG